MEPTIWVAILVSALVHAALLSKWLPQIRFPSPEELERRAISPPLVVNLTPRRIIPPTPPSAPPPAPRVKLRPPTAAAPPPPAPPVIALERPAPRAPPPAP
ncbi:MAG: energy transducer TonB, partial [Betaproteobacteria bacterium]|nr:energy transducer TonB [Betaproteobacteria bacterium]